MIELCQLIWCGLIGLFQPRAALEIEVPALRYQLNMLRRKSPGIPGLGRENASKLKTGAYSIQNTLQIRPTSRAVVYNRSKVPLHSGRCA
jgi:hypothetical protein